MSDKVTYIQDKKLSNFKKEILGLTKEATGLTEDNSNVSQAFDEAVERNKLYQAHNRFQEKELFVKHGIEIDECYNMVCKDYAEYNRCSMSNNAIDCIYRMTEGPPNPLNYNEYMPSHNEALDMLEKHNLLKGDRQRYKEAYSRYNSANNSEERENTEVKGIVFSQLKACILHILNDSGVFGDFKIGDKEDASILATNITIEVEKAMGIYPNIKLR